MPAFPGIRGSPFCPPKTVGFPFCTANPARNLAKCDFEQQRYGPIARSRKRPNLKGIRVFMPISLWVVLEISRGLLPRADAVVAGQGAPGRIARPRWDSNAPVSFEPDNPPVARFRLHRTATGKPTPPSFQTAIGKATG